MIGEQVEYDENIHSYSTWDEAIGGIQFLIFITCANVGFVFINC